MSKEKTPAFFTELDKSASKLKNVSNISTFPTFFIDTGNCILNKILSDRYDGGLAQGRISMYGAPADTGKSFLGSNAIRQAQKDGFSVLVMDTENALDTEYLQKIGVDVDSPLFNYKGMDSLVTGTNLLSGLFKSYNRLPKEEQTKLLIFIDSLDGLQTEGQLEKFEKGEQTHDRGQWAKQTKAFLNMIMHAIKPLPIHVAVTKQAYANQDEIGKKRFPYLITEALQFAPSQIVMATNTRLKDNTVNQFYGIKLKLEAHKTRFAKPFQTCIVEVPYDTGMDWYSGVLEAGVATGIINKNGAWYNFEGKKFQRNGFDDVKKDIYLRLKENEEKILNYKEELEEAGE